MSLSVAELNLPYRDGRMAEIFHGLNHPQKSVIELQMQYDARSTMNDSSSKSPQNTVTFDVGGSIYRVSRSLLEQFPNTMLARLASKTWQLAAFSDPLFIDRNGERFQYCLDYMRDRGKVVLPATIPKESLIQDLVYYGFEDVDQSTITVVKRSLLLFEDYLREFKSLDNELVTNIKALKFVQKYLYLYIENGKTDIHLEQKDLELDTNIKALKFVQNCLRSYTENGTTDIYLERQDIPDMIIMNRLRGKDEPWKQQVNKQLGKVGLKFVCCDYRFKSNYKIVLDHL